MDEILSLFKTTNVEYCTLGKKIHAHFDFFYENDNSIISSAGRTHLAAPLHSIRSMTTAPFNSKTKLYFSVIDYLENYFILSTDPYRQERLGSLNEDNVQSKLLLAIVMELYSFARKNDLSCNLIFLLKRNWTNLNIELRASASSADNHFFSSNKKRKNDKETSDSEFKKSKLEEQSSISTSQQADTMKNEITEGVNSEAKPLSPQN